MNNIIYIETQLFNKFRQCGKMQEKKRFFHFSLKELKGESLFNPVKPNYGGKINKGRRRIGGGEMGKDAPCQLAVV